MADKPDEEAPQDQNLPALPSGMKGGKYARAGLNVISAIPLAGGLLAAAAGMWGEHEQERINEFLYQWLKMMQAEAREKQQTILEITARLDMHDEETVKRVESPEYQSLLRKAFRDWSGAESEDKRVLIRNLLTNAAATRQSSDDVVKLFLQWIADYSELHFQIISKIYNNSGITRGGVWDALGRPPVREDSSDADLFRLLFRDLSTGGIACQHRETDYAGNFLQKQAPKPAPRRKDATAWGGSSAPRTMKSAFDDGEQYELTALGEQFVHYAMTDVPPKIAFNPGAAEGEATESSAGLG